MIVQFESDMIKITPKIKKLSASFSEPFVYKAVPYKSPLAFLDAEVDRLAKEMVEAGRKMAQEKRDKVRIPS